MPHSTYTNGQALDNLSGEKFSLHFNTEEKYMGIAFVKGRQDRRLEKNLFYSKIHCMGVASYSRCTVVAIVYIVKMCAI